MGMFHYLRRAVGLGVGVSNEPLVKPQTNARVDWFGNGTPVRGFLAPLEGPQVMALQAVTDVSLRGGGVYLSGAMQMGALTDFEKNTQKGGSQ